jgi:hypothetical protein
VFYRLTDGPARTVMATLYDLFCGPGAERRFSR